MRIDSVASAFKSVASPQESAPVKSGEDFGSMLMDAMKDVNSRQQDAAKLQNDVMAGRQVEYADVMIALEKASTAMALTMQVRNKVLEAYQEISRMSV